MTPTPSLKLALLQGPLLWHDVEGNLKYFTQVLDGLSVVPDVVVLPEMFTTGFTMKPQALAKRSIEAAQHWLSGQVEKLGCAICGSVVAEEEGRFYNRFLWAEPGNTYSPYDKRHLFRMAGEHEVYNAGNQRQLIEYKGWRIMPRICYDLRFPVWNRSHDAHVQLYVANWPSARIGAWDVLLRARAVENLCYVAGVNRSGVDGNEVAYPGHSAIIDYMGGLLTGPPHGEDKVLMATICMDDLLAFRQKFPAHLDADGFTLQA